MVRLLANSPYLEQADLDWREYYAEVEEDLKAARYSQHAAAFLLTLLLNVEMLMLPRLWMLLDATDKLIDAVVRSRISLATGLASPRSPDLGHLSR